MSKTNKNTFKNTWKKILTLFISLNLLAGKPSYCLANEKDEKEIAGSHTTKIFTKEDVEGWGWLAALIEANKLGLDEKELISRYTKEDLKVIRKLSDLFDTEDKQKQMAETYRKHKANEPLTDEENFTLQNYNKAFEELKKMLEEKH